MVKDAWHDTIRDFGAPTGEETGSPSPSHDDGCCGDFNEEDYLDSLPALPTGLVEPDSVPGFVFTPAFPVKADDGFATLIDWDAGYHEELEALPVFSSITALRSQLGEYQPWALVALDDVRTHAATRGVATIMLNPPAGTFPIRWTEEHWNGWKEHHGIG